MHHHTKTCRKYESTCRFYFPRLPTLRTIVSTPARILYKDLDPEEKIEKIDSAKKIKRKVIEVLEDKEAMKEIQNIKLP